MRIKEWVINRERIGKSCFSREDVVAAFPSLSARSINTSLAHFAKVGLIERLHRGFYCVVPPQYALSDGIHPYYYIDDLMSWLGRPYYVSLLSAASLWGGIAPEGDDHTGNYAIAPVEFVCEQKGDYRLALPENDSFGICPCPKWREREVDVLQCGIDGGRFDSLRR